MKTKDEVIDGYLTRHTPEGQVIRSELNGIWDNGYRSGYETAERKAKDKYEVDTNMQYNLGYQHGYDNGKDVAYKELSGWTVEEGKAKFDEAYHEGYDEGADDARYELWWAIKKLYLNPDEGGISAMDVMRIFGEHHIFSDILRNYTPEEVIEKVKSYEESKISAPTNRDKFEEVFGIRPDEDRQSVVLVSRNGCPHYIDLDKPYKEPEDKDNA